jgi:signal transduction histidine kinase/CheY-like chemotaxis protein
MRTQERLESLVRVAQHSSQDSQELLDLALEEAITLTRSKFGYIYYYNEEAREFVLNTWSKDVMKECDVVDPQTCYELDKTGIWGEVVRQRTAIMLNDFQAHHPLKKGYPEGHAPLHRFLSIPVFFNDRIVAVVAVANKESDYSQTDILQLTLLMDSVWRVIVQSQIEDEKQALEKQYQQTQKLESLGVLAGGIAHDFNNILAIIIGNCNLVRMEYTTAEVHVPVIEKAAERAAELCRQMLAYAGKASVSLYNVNLTALVEETVKMLKSALNQNVVIKTSCSAEIPTIKSDNSQLRQVVMNLIINASEAIGDDHGVIHVTLTKSEINAGHMNKDHLGADITPGGYVCLEVSDTGCGMDAATKLRVFEPFFTTKFTGRGLGMSAVLGIVTAHKGALQLDSQPGQGTTFKIYLPIHEEESRNTIALDKVIPLPWLGSGTILLVEDEASVLLIAKTMLKALGFAVIDASNGREAIELYQKHGEQITMVITDLGMPVMDGYTLLRELKSLNPELPIIISTGFGDIDVTTRITREELSGLLTKPFNFDQLRSVLQSALAG